MRSTGGALRLAGPGQVSAEPQAEWVDVCALDDIVPDTGVCALIGARQVAVMRVGAGDAVYALDNFDPIAKAFVLSRGIVGDARGVPKIASPINKRAWDLRTGRCLDDPALEVPVYEVRVCAGRVQLRGRAVPASP